MKKGLLLFMFIAASIVVSTNSKAGCFSGDTCNGVCVGVYSNSGSVTSYICSTGATAADKTCTSGTSPKAIEDVLAD